jgi:hypothetical protein
MPLLGFESRFAAAVENGVAAAHRRDALHPEVRPKRQTIRARRADGRDPKPGDTLYLYVGLRTKRVRKLGEVRCRRVERLRIAACRARVGRSGASGSFTCSVAQPGCRATRLDDAQLRRLARADGFENVEEFVAFFERRHGLPFDGYLIRW